MKSYFKFLSRNKLYTLIEVVGMAVAMAFVVFISTFVMDGYFTDRHIRQRGNMCVGYVSQYFNYTYRTADLLKGRFPEVEEMCRMMVTRQLRGVEMDVVREEGDEHQNALVVDDNFFEMFPFPLREGRAADVLKGDKIVLSESYARQHTREVAIHKIFGCGKRELFFSTALGFLRWVGVAIIAGLPVAWYLADKWLQDYPYRVDNSVWSYLVAAAVLVVVSVAAISWQVGRLVASQPVDSLKKE